MGGQPAKMLNASRATIEFEYPQLAPGDYKITLSRDNVTSNGVPVTMLAELAAGEGTQGGPFASKPEFAQKTIPMEKVRPRGHSCPALRTPAAVSRSAF